MDIELGIQNVARTVTFSTEQSADEVNNVIAEAVENGKTINCLLYTSPSPRD